MQGCADKELWELLQQVWQALRRGAPVVVTTHERLDGDAAGSVLALVHGLRRVGLEATAYFAPPVMAMFDFLPGMDQRCEDPARLPQQFTLVLLDCGSMERVGAGAAELKGRGPVINIDHHDGNTMFGDVNWVDPDASSCGEMLGLLLKAGGVSLDRQIAECLFSAIVTDTGQFSHRDTTPLALRVCADCLEAGVRPHKLIRKLFFSPSPAQMKLRHLALGTLRLHADGRIATIEVTEEMFRRTGLGPADTEGFAEIPISVQGVQASALLKEVPGSGLVRVSMRSVDEVDVREVAVAFGGGGHRNAAGCELPGPTEHVRRVVVAEMARRLKPHQPG